MPRRLLSSLIIILCLSNVIYPQQNKSDNIYSQQKKSKDNSIAAGYLQIKEGMNSGLIFKGPGLIYDFNSKRENEKRIIAYSFRFGFTYLETKEIAAANLNIIPLNFAWLFKSYDKSDFSIGPQLIAEYNYEIYPDLQSGYSFWFTHFSLGVSTLYKFNVRNNLFQLSFESTLLGFTSRQEVYDDPYFFDLSAKYVIQSVNSDLKFGSLNSYNRSEFQFRWQAKPESRVAFAYNLQYHGYYKEPKLTMLNQMLKVIILPKISSKFR